MRFLMQIYCILVGIIGTIESIDRRKKPPVNVTEDINETETFYSKVLSGHIRYCTNGRVCENPPYKFCHTCEKCYCDTSCLEFGDCCPDVALKQSKKTDEFEFDCVTSLVDSLYPLDIFQLKVNDSEKYNMLTSCPSSNVDQKKACVNSTSQPVSALDNIRTFRNKYCALCHNVTRTRDWKVSIQCAENSVKTFSSSVELVSNAIHQPNCSVKFQAPEGVSQRQCYEQFNTISQCNVTGLWSQYDEFVERACHSYKTITEVAEITYKNPFCFICNTDKPHLLLMQTICKRKSAIFTPSFTALLDFGDVLRNPDEVRKSECPKGTIYDPDKRDCRNVNCSYGRELLNQTCHSILGISRGTAYQIYFSLDLDQKILLRGPEDIFDDLPVALEEYFRVSFFETNASFHTVVFAFNTTSQYGNCSDYTQQLFFSANLITVNDVDQDTFEQKLLSMRNISFTYWIGLRHFNFTASVSEVAEKLGQTNKKTKSPSCMLTRTISEVVGEFTYVPVNGLLMCPQILLEPDEYHLDMGAVLRVEWSDGPISSDDFEIQPNSRVKICLHNFKPEIQNIMDGSLRKSTSFAESLVSIICTSMSLLCLLVSFVIYCVFNSLRSMPGKNNMNLIITLFLAQLLYLVGAGRTEVKGVCEAMGIFIHYFWLTAFSAMGVCSFHMFRVFTTMRSRDDSSEIRRRFLQYSIFIYGLPAVFVTITLISHIVATDGTTIGYGGNVCYLSSDLAIAVAFGIPVAITIILNSTFFVITLRSIKNRPKIEKSKHDEHHATVYIKLSTLTGITWTLGFLAILTGVQAVSYIFILVNASQGVFLFISFVCNARVKNLILQRGQEGSSGAFSRSSAGKTAVSVVVNSKIQTTKS